MDNSTNFNENKLPQGLNVLTILTFIGCAIGFIFSIFGYINAEKNVTNIQDNMNNPDLPAIAKSMMTPEALDNAKLMASNKLPLLILGIIGIALCFFGALQMRQRKMNGYYLWLTGEILPFITTAIFISFTSIYKGFALIWIAFTVLFILLYSLQRKYLINK